MAEKTLDNGRTPWMFVDELCTVIDNVVYDDPRAFFLNGVVRLLLFTDNLWMDEWQSLIGNCGFLEVVFGA